MTKLFITGATGYIGGDALFAIAKNHPDIEITALVRNSDKGAKVAAQYPKVRLVYGDLSSSELLVEEASKADIVVHTANVDHAPSAKKLIEGLSKNSKKTYLIHTSGTGILAFNDAVHGTYGKHSDKLYDDWDGIDEVASIGKERSLPDYAPHRPVDKIVLAANETSPNVQTAIICPPCIYGLGRGPDNQRSVQIYEMAKQFLCRRKGFVVEAGHNRWSEVHVRDLGELYSALVGAALNPEESKATWNKEGYYFAMSQETYWGEIARLLAKTMFDEGWLESAETDRITKDEANGLWGAAAFLWATNSRSKAIRANKLLGWTPKEKSMADLLPEVIEGEAKLLGLSKTHAQKAAGEQAA